MSDRKNCQNSIFIKRPFISVVGTIQKRLLTELANGERTANGFIDCILFAMSESAGKPKWREEEVSEERLNELHRTVYDHLAEEFSTADGIRVSARFGMKDHTFKMFLTRNLNILFRRVRQGLYCKLSCYSANNVTTPENESVSE